MAQIGLSERCWPIAELLNITGVEDLPERVEILREKFCLVIVEMCGLRTDYHSGTKNYKRHCLKAKQATHPFELQEEVGEM